MDFPRWTDVSCGGVSLDEAVVAAFDAGMVVVARDQHGTRGAPAGGIHRSHPKKQNLRYLKSKQLMAKRPSIQFLAEHS